MKSKLLLAAFLLIAFNSFSQTDTVKVKEVVLSKSPGDTAKEIVANVEVEATIDPQLWRDHLVEALQPYLEAAVKRGVPAGTYIVQVKFRIGKEGSISEVSALNDPGWGMAKGAVQVVKTGPKWTPGTINGRKVNSYRTQPITFVFSDK